MHTYIFTEKSVKIEVFRTTSFRHTEGIATMILTQRFGAGAARRVFPSVADTEWDERDPNTPSDETSTDATPIQVRHHKRGGAERHAA